MESSGDNNIINEEPKDKINENNKNLQSSQEKHFEATENIGFYSKKSFWNERFQISDTYFDWYADWEQLEKYFNRRIKNINGWMWEFKNVFTNV